MNNVIELKQPEEETPVHDSSTTIVERIEMTPELKQAFERAGYDVESKE